ncbi:MAG: nicotinate (nicotinamide) nucleotide adenylyltransferase [Verrucomicrobiae bacterium]|nr:nicotinate (nicotinamide) nucleotide adenylyltransferase [Verrucomicrobiae bacterium]
MIDCEMASPLTPGSGPPRRIALFGGTFDPVHDGHLFIASEARRLCDLDEVIFIPCWQSPHKQGQQAAASHHRVEMVRLAVEGLAWASVSDFEAVRAESSYSWQTAEHFAGALPGAQLFWLLGVDQWDVIDTWGRPDILAELLTFIVFGRNGRHPRSNPAFSSVFLPGNFDISATEIRHAIGENAIPEGLDARVADYVLHHQLYSLKED